MTDILMDVGGTGIKGTACMRGGTPEPLREFPASADLPAEELIRHFARIIQSLSAGRQIGALAMAFPGPFDYERGIPLMRGLAKYESLFGIRLTDAWEAMDIHPQKWYFINDISAYALGVAGTLPQSHRALTVCLGTGAGSAFLIDGKLCSDKREGIPENGWIYALPYGETVIDDYLSDRGIRRLSMQYLGRELSPRELNADEPAYDAVWDAFGRQAAEALGGVFHAFRPTDLVLGGKIALAFERFGGRLRDVCVREGIRLWLRPETSLWTVRGLVRAIQT